MRLEKCPRCDLNYIDETEELCRICKLEKKGVRVSEEPENCSVCMTRPPMPGHDVCLACQKEIEETRQSHQEGETTRITNKSITHNAVSSMDEMLPSIKNEIPKEEYDKIATEFGMHPSSDENEGEK